MRAFRKEYGDIIVKPLYGNGGAGVFRITKGDQNLASLIEMFQDFYPEPFIVQKYLADVRKGDKRIILVLKEQGQIFVGIDVIGDYLTEINVTSPTGIQEIKRFDGTDIAVLIWDAIEAKL